MSGRIGAVPAFPGNKMHLWAAGWYFTYDEGAGPCIGRWHARPCLPEPAVCWADRGRASPALRACASLSGTRSRLSRLPVTVRWIDAVDHADDPSVVAQESLPRVIIAGGGPVGLRTAQELSQPGIDSVMINADRWEPCNRVRLTLLPCGASQLGQEMQPLTFPGSGRVDLYSEAKCRGHRSRRPHRHHQPWPHVPLRPARSSPWLPCLCATDSGHSVTED